MKNLLLILLFVFITAFTFKHVKSADAQTTFISSTGAIVRNTTPQTYTNSVTTDQILFASTISANTMMVDKPYIFSTDLNLVVPSLSIPSISFDVKLGPTAILTFVSSAGMIAGTNSTITVSGYLVRKADNTILVKFGVSPPTTLAGINFTTANTTQTASWNTIDTTVDNSFSINVSFGGVVLSNVNLTRLFYIRSEF